MKTAGNQLSAKISSTGLLLSLVAAVCIGCQTRQWSWGFALLFLGLAMLAALPTLLTNRFRLSPWITGIALVTAAWFSWRTWTSPVREPATSDFLLLLLAAGGGAVAGLIFTNRRSATLFLWGLGALIASSFVVSLIQNQNPAFVPILRARPYAFPSGFFGHYNECANFFIGASLLLGAFTIQGWQRKWVRILWGLISLSGIAGVYLSHSRGGILAVVAGLSVGMVLLFVLRRGSRWFGVMLIGAPVVILIAIGFIAKGWEKAQQARGAPHAETIDYQLADEVLGNHIRLVYLEIGVEAVGKAPLAGSGSGSFGWNVYQFWNTDAHGAIQSRPELAHNELMQAATDYGILGAGLIVVLFVALAINGGVKCLTVESGDEHLRPAILGGAAGLTGMFVQSCFSSVFHLSPGALLLGICLGALSAGARTISDPPPGRIRRLIPGLPMMAAAAILIVMAVPRIRMTSTLWNVYFKGTGTSSSWGIAQRLDNATRIIPLPSTLAELGMILFRISRSDDPLAKEAEERAIEAYRASVSSNPMNPTASLNLANLLSNSGKDEEAENEYRRTIRLQGTGENLFLGHFRLAEHFLRKGVMALNSRDPEAAVRSFEIALSEIAESDRLAPWLIQGSHQGVTLVSDVNENLGYALEMSGDFEGALECYNAAAAIFPKSHYHVGRVMETIARAQWNERKSSQALWMFQKALDHLKKADPLPNGVTPGESAARTAEIETIIRFLTEAGIQPIER